MKLHKQLRKLKKKFLYFKRLIKKFSNKKRKKRLNFYRQKYRTQILVSSILLLILIFLTVQWPTIWAAPQSDDIDITANAQWSLGTLDDIIVVGNAIQINGDGGADWLSGYQYRLKATFDASSLLAAVSNIPIMVHVDNSAKFNGFWSNIEDAVNGNDVVFADSDGTALDFHFEKFDYAGKDLISWVEVPQLKNNATDHIYMYYGKVGAANTQDEKGTYNNDGGYLMVQHLEESPANGIEGHLDSTSSNIDGTPNNFNSTPTSSTDATGKIDGADIFDGSNDYIDLGSSNDITGDNLQNITISIWVKYVHGSQSRYPFSIKRISGASSLITIVINSKTTNDNTSGYLGFLTRNNADSAHKWLTHKLGSGYNDGNWHHVVAVVDGLNRTLYIDGVQRGTDSEGMQSVIGNTYPATIGSFDASSYMFPGTVDEIRISNISRSNDWVKAVYLSESDNLINTWGAEESALQSPGTYTSHSLNAEKIYKWGDCTGGGCNGASTAFTTNLTSPANTSIKFELRHSANGSVWSDWTTIDTYTSSGTKTKTRDQMVSLIGDITNRYIKVKITLDSTDNISNPIVADYKFDYTKDVDEPSSNPDTFHCYNSASKSTEYITNTWYNDSKIYCEWSGATDAHSGVSGYYVYFNSNNSADPEIRGTAQSASNITASGFSNNVANYLRLKTYDVVGNTTSSTAQGFIYRYDETDPENPSGILPDPAGFTNDNSFIFTWSAGTDIGGSGMEEYCYRTGDPDFIEVCTSDTTVSGIQAYREGTNIFYVRSKDNAGNLPTSYTSVNYYYSEDAPSAPTNLAVNPSSNTENSFTFTWDEPTEHDNDIAGYYYSINGLPNENNTTYTTQTSVGPDSFATQQETNIFYVVAIDEVDNIEWNAYASIEFEATTTAPGIPESISITDSSNRDEQQYMLTVTWNEPTDTGSGVDHYIIQRSTDSECADGNGTFEDHATTEALGYLDSGLSNTITYCYRVKSADNANAVSAVSSIVSALPEGRYTEPPDLIGSPSASLRIQSAVIEWLTDRECSSFVEFGTTQDLGEEQGLDNFVSSHSVTILDLEPDMTYYYRVKFTDQDGNTGYSSIDEFTTEDAPSAPTNLTVTPESNTENSFKFRWDEPVDEGVDIQGYLFSINSTPNADNVSFTAKKSVGPGAYATRQGVNTFYIVAIDESNNVNYSNYASVDFIATTPAPEIPTGLVITDSSNREQQIYSITLVWQDIKGDDITYVIERSIDNQNNYIEIAEINSYGYIDIGLDNTKIYYYKIKAKDSAGAYSAESTVVSEKPEGKYRTPPEITEGPSVIPDSFSTIVSWRTEREADSHIELGLNQNSLEVEQGTGDLVEAHAVNCTGLTAETKYYYRIRSRDIDGNIAYSKTNSFTTLEAPRVSDVVISDIGLYEALITWQTNKDTTTEISYGTSANYGSTNYDTTSSYSKIHTIKLTGLSDGTIYHIKPSGLDSNGNITESSDYLFTTHTFPQVSNITSENIAEGKTQISWTTNVTTSSQVEYYNEKISPKTQGNASLTTNHSILLYGLQDATTYKYRVRGADSYGYEDISEEKSFITLEDKTMPEVFNVSAISNSIGSGEASSVQIVISWNTNEPTSSYVDYGQGIDSNEFPAHTDENTELKLEHLVVIPELDPSKTYRFKITAKDRAGNITETDNYSVLTSRGKQSLLDIVIYNLEDAFAWVKNIGN